jgi:ABC-type oligopeptide transport system ATPase subunit
LAGLDLESVRGECHADDAQERCSIAAAGIVLDQVFGNPRHAYTRRLLDAVLLPDPSRRTALVAVAEGEVPSSIHPIGHTPERVRLRDVGGRHLVAEQ